MRIRFYLLKLAGQGGDCIAIWFCYNTYCEGVIMMDRQIW